MEGNLTKRDCYRDQPDGARAEDLIVMIAQMSADLREMAPHRFLFILSKEHSYHNQQTYR